MGVLAERCRRAGAGGSAVRTGPLAVAGTAGDQIPLEVSERSSERDER